MQIGSGGFATVYKGILGTGMVAVKKLFETFDVEEKRFNEEVDCLMDTRHTNIVRFLGYCSNTRSIEAEYQGKIVMADERQRLLCFEYLPRGSLDKYITRESCVLEWIKCYEIIKGICDGLHYLHSKQRIVHLDLKPTNILLDDKMVPKIADFGLSRRFGEKQSQTFTSKLFGTLGYMAPEFLNGQITFKLDIYSLGIIIIEMMTGKKGYHDVEDVLDIWRNRLPKSWQEIHMEQLRVCAQIGMECIDNNPAKRPVTQNIIDRLVEIESRGCSIQTSGSSSSVPQAEKDYSELHQWTPKAPGGISYDETGIILMRRYVVGRQLGQGNFAKVYCAQDLTTGEVVAIKMIDKDKVSRVGLMAQKEMEVSIVRKISHPNIVHLFEVMASKSKMYLVLEYAKGGELLNKISEGKFSEDVARVYFYQLISAVGYCHSRGIYHGDLKPENLLLDQDGYLKISGFGLSALAEPKRHDGLLHTTCQTSAYEAPEVLSKKGYDGAKADIWSCGVILLVLLAGYLPFQDTNLINMYMKISRAEYRCPRPLSAELKELLSMILDPDPVSRASISMIKKSVWFRKHTDANRLEIKHETIDKVYKGQDKTSDLTECSNSVDHEVSTSLTNLNAFDIISLSKGFNISTLLEEKYHLRNDKFTTTNPAETIFAKLNELAKKLKLRIKILQNGLLRLIAPKEGMKGFVEFDTAVSEITPTFLLVEFEKTNGDTIEYEQLMKDEIRPALKDVVWAWQDDLDPL
uniref:Uncharacterized protein n=1 Tax=Avena sativa TaxID=4498 RepID=A0ACD5YP18_AVESA